MSVVRWMIGVWVLLMGGAALLSFAVFIGTGIDLWVRRARKFRHWTFAAAMFWFNLEIWRRVVLIIVHW